MRSYSIVQWYDVKRPACVGSGRGSALVCVPHSRDDTRDAASAFAPPFHTYAVAAAMMDAFQIPALGILNVQ